MKTLLILLFSLPCFASEPATTNFVAFPADCNANPPMVFGGKILSEMDRCAGIATRRFLYGSTVTNDAVTVSINNVVFHKGAEVKDLVIVTGTVVKAGTKSITVHVVVERELKDNKRELLVDGDFVFCTYDLKNKQAVAHGVVLK